MYEYMLTIYKIFKSLFRKKKRRKPWNHPEWLVKRYLYTCQQAHNSVISKESFFKMEVWWKVLYIEVTPSHGKLITCWWLTCSPITWPCPMAILSCLAKNNPGGKTIRKQKGKEKKRNDGREPVAYQGTFLKTLVWLSGESGKVSPAFCGLWWVGKGHKFNPLALTCVIGK